MTNEYTTTPLVHDISEHFWGRIATFTRRGRDLDEFIRSNHWGQHSMEIDRQNEHRPRISGSLPDESLLELLYRRFRFFILKREKSNYQRLQQLLSAATTSEVARSFLLVSRDEFLTNDALDFAFITAQRPYGPEEVIDCWFNAFYFHDNSKKGATLAEFRSVVSNNGAKVALWHTIWDASYRVRRLNWLLRDTNRKNATIYIPHLCRI